MRDTQASAPNNKKGLNRLGRFPITYSACLSIRHFVFSLSLDGYACWKHVFFQLVYFEREKLTSRFLILKRKIGGKCRSTRFLSFRVSNRYCCCCFCLKNNLEFTMNASPITRINVQSKADLLLEQYAKSGSLTAHNVVLVMVGDDFRFDHEIEWDQQFHNYQSLFNFVNANKKLYNGTEISFGTLSDYFDAVRKRVRHFPTLKGDFFPYADIFSEGRPAYWTGYFTSRPFYKVQATTCCSTVQNHISTAIPTISFFKPV